MELIEAIAQRHSVRVFTDRKMEKEVIEDLQTCIDDCNREGRMHIQLVTDDPNAFDSWIAHYGHFANVRNYLVVAGRQDSDFDERCGYYGEKVVLRAQQLGLNTCWVGVSYSKRKTVCQLNDGEKMGLVIALGYGAAPGRSHRVRAIERVARWNGEMPDWFKRGVEAALLAPTAVNQQKFSFTLEAPGKVRAKAGFGPYTKMDLGIVKYHFEVGAGKENFEWL